MGDPISLGAVFAGIGSAFKFADLAIRIAEVGSENEVFVRTIRVVRDDLNEVERLLNVTSVQRNLTGIPGKLPWIKGAVINTKSALNEIGKWVERARSEKESTGTIHFDTRVKWVFSDHEKLLNRKTELTTCHQQLLNVLNYLAGLEEGFMTSEPPQYTDTTFDEILSRHRQRPVWKPPHTSVKYTGDTSGPATGSRQPWVSQNIETISSPSFGQATVSQNTNIPTKPLYSPSPSYMSLVKPSSQGPLVDSTASATVKSHIHLPHTDTLSEQKHISDFHRYDEQEEVRAYEYVNANVLLPELPGDTVCMSGTNSEGPVNPFDFSLKSSSESQLVQNNNDETNKIGELLGDLTFANPPLPSNPGPPPGYPPIKAQHAASHAHHKLPSRVKLDRSYRKPLPELSSETSCRRLATHANTDVGPILHNATASTSTNSSQATSHEQRGKPSIFELPSSPCQSPETNPPYAIENAYLSSNQVPPTHAVKGTRAPLAKNVSFPHPNQQNYNLQTASEPTYTDLYASSCQVAKDSALSARMQRQKIMLDLLGSLGS